MLAHEKASTRHPVVQTFEKTLVHATPPPPCPTPRSTWPRRRDPPAATACNEPASSGSTTSRRSSGRAALPRSGQVLSHTDPRAVPGELVAQARCPSGPPAAGGGSAAPTARRPGRLPSSPSARIARRSSTVCRDRYSTVPIPSGSVFDRLTSRRPDPSGSHVTSAQVAAAASPLLSSPSRITDASAMSTSPRLLAYSGVSRRPPRPRRGRQATALIAARQSLVSPGA